MVSFDWWHQRGHAEAAAEAATAGVKSTLCEILRYAQHDIPSQS